MYFSTGHSTEECCPNPSVLCVWPPPLQIYNYIGLEAVAEVIAVVKVVISVAAAVGGVGAVASAELYRNYLIPLRQKVKWSLYCFYCYYCCSSSSRSSSNYISITIAVAEGVRGEAAARAKT